MKGSAGDDEMFREKILPWAKIIDLFTLAMGTILAHAKVELRSQASNGAYLRSNVTMNPMAFGTQRELAAAYVCLASLNR